MFTLRKHEHGLGHNGKTAFRTTYLNFNGAPHPDANVDLTPLEYVGAAPLDLIRLSKAPLGGLLLEIDKIRSEELSPEISGTKWGAINTARGNDWDDPRKLPTALRELTIRTETLLREIFPKEVLDGEIQFNDFSLRKYSSGEGVYAISPHRDDEKYINLIVIWMLKGNPAFYICADNKGSNAELIECGTGQPVILRGNGYAGISHRPYHFVHNTGSDRVTFTLRQARKSS
jgi:hypothetical protein